MNIRDDRTSAPVMAAKMKANFGLMVGLTSRDWLYIHVFTGYVTWSWGLKEFWRIERTRWGRDGWGT